MNKEHKALLEKTRQAVQKEMRRKEFKDWVKKKGKRKKTWNRVSHNLEVKKSKGLSMFG